VDSFPTPNFGTEVVESEASLAADGPMVAMTLSRMGLTTGLLANSLAEDSEGRAVMRHLRDEGVTFLGSTSDSRSTSPSVVVITNRTGERTWFPYLPGVESELANSDYGRLIHARIVYVDCYAILRPAVEHVLIALAEMRKQVFLNLGGCELDDQLLNTLSRCQLLTVQTNLDEGQAHDAEALAGRLRTALHPDLTVVTMGAAGALVLSDRDHLRIQAYPVTPVRVHGAGALFSAGLIASIVGGRRIEDAMRYASACGAYQCVRPTQHSWPSRTEIDEFVHSHEPAPDITTF
jgi:sugar/nucleoside kinase (ribokinase family)